MNSTRDPTDQVETNTTPRTYDCTSCRYVDGHGLVCGFCLKKVLDEHAARKRAALGLGCTAFHHKMACLISRYCD